MGDYNYKEDCLHSTVLAEELYNRDAIHARIKEHASDRYADMLESLEITADKLSVRWCMIEDGVIHYKVTHPDMPELPHEHLSNTGPNTKHLDAQSP